MIGISPGIKEVFTMVSKIAPLDCNVLIQGESGTGKELVARLIHRESRRKDHPFVAFNCGVFTQELIASELFGYRARSIHRSHCHEDRNFGDGSRRDRFDG